MKFELCAELMQIRGLPYGGWRNTAIPYLWNAHDEYGSEMHFTGMLWDDGLYAPMGVTIADSHDFILDLRRASVEALG